MYPLATQQITPSNERTESGLEVVDMASPPWEPSAGLVAALEGFELLVAQIDGAEVIGRPAPKQIVIDLVDPVDSVEEEVAPAPVQPRRRLRRSSRRALSLVR